MERLTEIVSVAYDRGVSGCGDLRQQEVDDLLRQFQGGDDYRVWKIEELRKLPVGTIFEHIHRGRCWVETRAAGTKYMQFLKGPALDFNSDRDPWDKPMRRLEDF